MGTHETRQTSLSSVDAGSAGQWLGAVLESLPIGFWAIDRGGLCVLQSAESRRQSGEMLGRRPEEVAPKPELASNLAAALAQAWTGETVREETTEMIGGVPRHLLRLVFPLRDAGKTVGVAGLALDVTDPRLLDEQLQRAQRLEHLGLFAGGIAHDFNNLLMAVVGHISLSRMHQRVGVPADALLDEAERACLRAQALTQQLLTFAKGGEPLREVVRIGDLVRESAHLAVGASTCHCEFDIAADLEPVLADLGQIHQVILNLVLNAVQAMPQGGTVTLVARNVELAPGAPLALAPGRYVCLEVRDQGAGIPPEQLGKVFDPYFTTAPVGQGLGLAVAFSIANRHQGTIAIQSEPGAGTVAAVYLPAAIGAPASAMAGVAPVTVPHGSGPVLVLDDEATVRSVTSVMLKSLGYSPASAASCYEAAAICARAREEQRPIRLAILDLTVPGGQGGKECLRRLLDVEPRLRAIVTSGYTNDPVLADFRNHGFVDVLTKPFSRERLAIVLDRALREGQGTGD